MAILRLTAICKTKRKKDYLFFFGLIRMADTLKKRADKLSARLKDLKELVDKHRADFKESNNSLLNFIENDINDTAPDTLNDTTPDTLKARAADIKQRADKHHADLKESNRPLWDLIEAARARGLGSGAPGYGNQSYGTYGYGYSVKTPSKLVTIDELYTKYNIFKGGKNTLWKDIYGPYYAANIPTTVSELTKVGTTTSFYLEPSKNKDFLEHIADFNTTFDGTYPSISGWVDKKQKGGFTTMKEFVLEKLGITITATKEITAQNKKVISFCLFNPFFKQGIAYNKTSAEILKLRKPPHFYGKVLNYAIESYKHYMPDWIIRLYVDDTISSSGNIGNPPETEAAIQNLKAYANGEVYTINFDKIHKKIGMGHLGLIPVMFRFLPYFDENITTCFIGDADNYCSFLMKDILGKFDASSSELLIFKTAVGYARVSPEFPDKKECIENFLAGMFGFKKKQGEILNPNIWLDLFIFMDFYYKKMYLTSTLPENPTTHTRNYVKMCAIDLRIPDSPFFYGFEELALTYIFPLYVNKFNIDVFIVPIYFDMYQSDVTFVPIELKHNPFNQVTSEYKDFMTSLLLATIKNKSIFSSDDYYRLAFSIFNYPVLFLAYSFTSYFAFKNIDTITFKGKQIQIFTDKTKFIEELAILPFTKLYPADLGETENGTKVSPNFIYGEDAQNQLNQMLYSLETTPPSFDTVDTAYTQLYKSAKGRVEANSGDFIHNPWQQQIAANIKESMIIDQFNSVGNMPAVVISGGSRKFKKQSKKRQNRTYKK